MEMFAGEVVLRDPRDVAYHLELFEFFKKRAVRGDDATRLLRMIAQEFLREGE
ncbi:hypothetical protein AB0J40_29690 [Amycolatopsis sp. NPDC049691]|uniref:hypothetical protein n=1 Tax=Amycolatopsis sp. NPDC049691 TaxID=3155155 RepID=UPI00344386AB